MKLYFPRSAKDENEATPLGNGHVGLWAYRRGDEEIVHLNECTFWSGGPREPVDSHLYERAQRAKELLYNRKFKEAEKALKEGSRPIDSEEYDPIGDLLIYTPGEKAAGGVLDMAEGILTVENKIFSRSYFVSYPDRVFVIHLKADAASNFSLGFRNKNVGSTKFQDNKLVAYGNAIHDGMAFCLVVRVLCDGAVNAEGEQLRVNGATEATVIGTVVTGFKTWNEAPEKDGKKLFAQANEIVDRAAVKSYAELKSAHVSDYKKLFDRSN